MSAKPDIGQLRQFYRTNKTASLYLDFAAQQSGDQIVTKVDQVLGALTARGVKLTRGQIIELFRSLESLGCGQFRAGTLGSQTARLVWSVRKRGEAVSDLPNLSNEVTLRLSLAIHVAVPWGCSIS